MLANFSLQDALISFLVVTLSLSVHEYAHARAAFQLGDDTAYRMGRMTLNPMSHLDPLGAIAFVIARIGWAKPVPINPARFSKIEMRKGIVLVSLAGPISNLVLAFVATFCAQIFVLGLDLLQIKAALATQSVIWGTLINVTYKIIASFYYANVALAIFNLLPIPPLDGYKIFGALLPRELYYRLMSYERYIGMVLMGLALVGGGLISRVISTLSIPFHFVLQWPLEKLFSVIRSILI